jgi:hypothetical protein
MGRPPGCASEPSLHAIALTCAGRVRKHTSDLQPQQCSHFCMRQYWTHEYCMIGAAMHAALPRFRSHGVIVSAADCAGVRTKIRNLGCFT